MQDMTYEGAKASVTRSLELLQMDYLDLVLLHHPIGDIWGAWRALEELYGKSVGHVMLRWLLQRGISTISKSMRPAQMRDNLNVFDFELTEPEMAEIATMNTGETLFGGSDDLGVVHVEKMLNWTVTH